MSRKKSSKTEDPIRTGKNGDLQSNDDREKKIMNSIVNASIILMSTMMGAFTEVMVKTTGAMASGVAEAFDGDGEKVDKEIMDKMPEVDEKIKAMISDLRKDVYAQLEQKSKEIKPLLSDAVFDSGPKIIGKYDFKLPKLTEELNDGELAQYAQLLVSEDTKFMEMFKELTDWMNALPISPNKTNEG